MINNFKVINFKSHKETSVELKNLTVLCGQNGVGKSSLIQALLLLRQTHLDNQTLNKKLNLIGQLCNIGNKKDALYLSNQGEFFEKIVIEINSFKWIFDASTERNFLNLINQEEQDFGYKELSLFNANFQYVSAYRGAEYIPARDYEVIENKQVSYSEGKGDMVAHFLFEYGNKIKVIDSLHHSNQLEFPYLNEQVSAWESEICKGVEVKAEKTMDDRYDIRYKFDVSSFEKPEHIFTSKNVGFGLSYTLPILVAILSAQSGALIIIENPEAHLHPNGIARLMELICKAAQAGIQIIIETHSDHVINGILVQSKLHEESEGSSGINKDNVIIYQFERDEKEHCSVAIPIKVEEDGRIRYAPKGFFDQFSIDRKYLMGF